MPSTAVATAEESDVACYPVDTTELPVANFVPAREEVTPFVSTTPSGPGPLVYILPIGFGLVFGTLLGPWIERLRNRKQGDE
jgi:hypothetical protein